MADDGVWLSAEQLTALADLAAQRRGCITKHQRDDVDHGYVRGLAHGITEAIAILCGGTIRDAAEWIEAHRTKDDDT